MKIKIFTPDSNGNISFNKKELEKLLNEVYEDGYNDGKVKGYIWYPSNSSWYTTTAQTINSSENRSNTITCDLADKNNIMINYGETKNINSNSSL